MMIKFLECSGISLSLAIYYAMIFLVFIGISAAFIIYRMRANYENGLRIGKADLNRSIVQAGNSGYKAGYKAAIKYSQWPQNPMPNRAMVEIRRPRYKSKQNDGRGRK